MTPTVGSPSPLGPSIRPGGLNFAVYSSVAESVEVCVFTPDGEVRHRLPGHTGAVHHGFLPGLGSGARYGYRVTGRWDPSAGDFCDPEKLLTDPYAIGVELPGAWAPPSFTGAPGDSAATGIRSVALAAPPSASIRPRVPWADTVIYEANVKGLTAAHPAIPSRQRGTFAGVASDAVLHHLAGLGVTTIELLPTAAFVSEPLLVTRGLTQFWGYNPASFFAPHPAYATDGTAETAVAEFAAMVDRLHTWGLELIIDVVLNHTAEGPIDGPHLSWRGLDNRAYYRREDDGTYVNWTGTGNTFDLSSPPALEQAIAALHHWANLGVDGFRFDLATTLGRSSDSGFSTEASLIGRIDADPVLRGLKLIAEPWDLGDDGYQLSHFPDGWREWNDRFRDTARRFWRSEWEANGELMRRLSGSQDLFPSGSRAFHSSINYVTAHDGYTLRDLVSFEQRHNLANAEDNRDGHTNNLSWNSGVEGPSNDPAIRDLRDRRARSLLATLLLADGVPMVLAGDELGRTQGGNNNAYCQDNAVSWIDWPSADPRLVEFTADVIRLRSNRAIRWGWHTAAFFDASGQSLDPSVPGGHFLGILLGPERERTALLLLNGGHLPTRGRLPSHEAHREWVRALDTKNPSTTPATARDGDTVMVDGFSVQVYLRAPGTTGGPATAPPESS